MPRLKTLGMRVATLGPRLAAPPIVERERGAKNQRTRARHFERNPLCVRCEAAGRTAIATQLDHIVALINGGTNDDSNRQGLCDSCHEAKTAEDLGRATGAPF